MHYGSIPMVTIPYTCTWTEGEFDLVNCTTHLHKKPDLVVLIMRDYTGYYVEITGCHMSCWGCWLSHVLLKLLVVTCLVEVAGCHGEITGCITCHGEITVSHMSFEITGEILRLLVVLHVMKRLLFVLHFNIYLIIWLDQSNLLAIALKSGCYNCCLY